MDTQEKQEQEPSAGKSSDPAHEKRSLWRRKPAVVAGSLLLGFLVFLGLRYLADGWTHESTDDAFLDTHIVTIAPRVARQVQRVAVNDNQLAQTGQALVELDARDLQALLEEKRAACAPVWN